VQYWRKGKDGNYRVVRIYGKKYVSKSFKNIDDAKQWRDLKLKEMYE
jgi:hypothetical protein